MDIKLWSNPKYTQSKSKPITVNIEPGITMLIGPNGSGKSTMLRQLDSIFSQDALQQWEPIPANKNIEKKYRSYYYNNTYEQQYAKQRWLENNNTERLAKTFENSEGQDMWDYLYYKTVDIGRTVKLCKAEEREGIFILLDAMDSGLSLNLINKLRKELLEFIVEQEQKLDFDVYIICSANSYELCNNYNCIDVRDYRHIVFTKYEQYEQYFIEEE